MLLVVVVLLVALVVVVVVVVWCGGVKEKTASGGRAEAVLLLPLVSMLMGGARREGVEDGGVDREGRVDISPVMLTDAGDAARSIQVNTRRQQGQLSLALLVHSSNHCKTVWKHGGREEVAVASSKCE